MAREGKRAPPRRIRNPFAYGTRSYYEHREKALAARQRAQRLAARRDSKKAARNARETARVLEKVRASKRFAETVDRTGTRNHIRHMIRSFDRLPAAVRRKIDDLRALYGSRPVPGNVDVGLSKLGWWLFFRAGGQTQ
jgi:hypothetical protein